MKFFKLPAILIVASLPFASITAQTINVGDRCPDIALQGMLNVTSGFSNLSQFRGKHILVDLWATWCTVCIDKLGELQRLQQKFPDNLQIILVTSEPKEKVESLFIKYERLKGIKLMIATSDSTFKKYFPHNTVPHEIWIDATGKVVAITGANDVTENNLLAFITGNLTTLPVKKDFVEYSINRPLIAAVAESASVGETINYTNSFFGTYIEGLSGRLTNSPYFNNRNESFKLTGINSDISDLYRMAYRLDSRGTFYPGKIIHDYPDKKKYLPDYTSGRNLFCYEITIPVRDSTSLYKRMQQDLDNNLGVQSRLVKKKISCIVLRKLEGNRSIPNNEGTADWYFENERIIVQNLSTRVLVNNVFMYWKGLKMPVLDESGFKGLISMELPKSYDLHALKKALNEYGIQPVITERMMDVVVLTSRQ